jgi:hypothetical protein
MQAHRNNSGAITMKSCTKKEIRSSASCLSVRTGEPLEIKSDTEEVPSDTSQARFISDTLQEALPVCPAVQNTEAHTWVPDCISTKSHSCTDTRDRDTHTWHVSPRVFHIYILGHMIYSNTPCRATLTLTSLSRSSARPHAAALQDTTVRQSTVCTYI